MAPVTILDLRDAATRTKRSVRCNKIIMSSIAEQRRQRQTYYVNCANCGAAEIDDIKLKIICDDGCGLVKYCSDKCSEEHREEHEEECKTRRTLLHDRKLFTQPDETHRGELMPDLLLADAD